jgi:hypothetical protein
MLFLIFVALVTSQLEDLLPDLTGITIPFYENDGTVMLEYKRKGFYLLDTCQCQNLTDIGFPIVRCLMAKKVDSNTIEFYKCFSACLIDNEDICRLMYTHKVSSKKFLPAKAINLMYEMMDYAQPSLGNVNIGKISNIQKDKIAHVQFLDKTKCMMMDYTDIVRIEYDDWGFQRAAVTETPDILDICTDVTDNYAPNQTDIWHCVTNLLTLSSHVFDASVSCVGPAAVDIQHMICVFPYLLNGIPLNPSVLCGDEEINLESKVTGDGLTYDSQQFVFYSEGSGIVNYGSMGLLNGTMIEDGFYEELCLVTPTFEVLGCEVTKNVKYSDNYAIDEIDEIPFEFIKIKTKRKIGEKPMDLERGDIAVVGYWDRLLKQIRYINYWKNSLLIKEDFCLNGIKGMCVKNKPYMVIYKYPNCTGKVTSAAHFDDLFDLSFNHEDKDDERWYTELYCGPMHFKSKEELVGLMDKTIEAIGGIIGGISGAFAFTVVVFLIILFITCCICWRKLSTRKNLIEIKEFD